MGSCSQITQDSTTLKAWLMDFCRDQRAYWAAFFPPVLLGWGEHWVICKINSIAFLSTQFCTDKYPDMESIREASSIFNNACSPSLNYFENICWRKRCCRGELRSQMAQLLCLPHFTPEAGTGTSQGDKETEMGQDSAWWDETDLALVVMCGQVTPHP